MAYDDEPMAPDAYETWKREGRGPSPDLTILQQVSFCEEFGATPEVRRAVIKAAINYGAPSLAIPDSWPEKYTTTAQVDRRRVQYRPPQAMVAAAILGPTEGETRQQKIERARRNARLVSRTPLKDRPDLTIALDDLAETRVDTRNAIEDASPQNVEFTGSDWVCLMPELTDGWRSVGSESSGGGSIFADSVLPMLGLRTDWPQHDSHLEDKVRLVLLDTERILAPITAVQKDGDTGWWVALLDPHGRALIELRQRLQETCRGLFLRDQQWVPKLIISTHPGFPGRKATEGLRREVWLHSGFISGRDEPEQGWTEFILKPPGSEAPLPESAWNRVRNGDLRSNQGGHIRHLPDSTEYLIT